MAPTKWGIVSAGKISHDFVACLRSLSSEEHQIVAVAGRNFDTAKAFAQLHGIPKVYGSYEELAQDGDVEIAYVGCLNPDHYKTSKLLFDHGKHVLCEKPLTTHLKHTQDLLRTSQEKKLFLMEAIWSLCNPAYLNLKAQLDKGLLGQVSYINVTFGHASMSQDRVIKKDLGGSAMLDIGIYCLALIDFLYGGDLPEKVQAVGTLTDEGVDIGTAVSMKFSNGRLATFTASLVMDLPNAAEIVGTTGTVRIEEPFWSPTRIETPCGPRDYVVPKTVVPCNYKNSGSLCYEANEVRRCLLGGSIESAHVTHKTTERIAFLTCEIFKQLGVSYVHEPVWLQ
ncbi:trans-1,2-dihydrobenzene-1,2-diol dehydrogenase-like [Ornithodoros turicata]|uniref:trans-1,2-dihydrobenzene-1,2-diol dehydrogenase-like n=1 Tax=Ornithodoros turicata TaxID=34597 RepID=UPI003139D985